MSDSDRPLLPLTLPERVALEQRLLARRRPRLERVDVEEAGPQPLTFAQESLWFLYQLAPSSPVYNMPLAFRLVGRLDAGALERALQALLKRQSALRTRFYAEDGVPQQQVNEQSLQLQVLDLSGLSVRRRDEELDRLLQVEASTPFHLSQDLLLRARLIRLGSEEHALALTLHHIVADFSSIAILCRELSLFYNAFVANRGLELPPLPLSFGSWARRHREVAGGPSVDRALEFWKMRLGTGSPAVDLPTDRPRPSERSFKGGRHLFHVVDTLAARLNQIAQPEGATLNMLLLAAFNVLLFRYSGQEDLVVGSPMNCRTDVEAQEVIGLFLNTLPLRMDLSGDPTFRELLRRAREVAISAFSHQEAPFERVIEALRLPREAGVSRLCPVMFQYLPMAWPAPKLEGIVAAPLPTHARTSKFDLTLTLVETGTGLAGELEYDSGLFDDTTAARLSANLGVLLESIAGSPDESISRLPLLTPAEMNRVLVEWNDTATEFPRHSTVQALFEEQARLRPEAVALVAGRQCVTYADLNRRANQLARRLVRQGVTRGARVGLCLERSIEMIVGLLAILKAGGAYVPLDPDYPAERLKTLAETTPVAAVISRSDVACVSELACALITLDTDETPISREGDADLAVDVSAEDVAYIMFTSGSTGHPKAVCVPHRAIVRLVRNANYARFGADEVFLQFAPLSFDASTFEIWGALLNGARLVLHPVRFESVEQLVETIARNGVTTIWLTAGLFHQVVEGRLERLASVRQLLAGGDVLSPAHVVRALKALPHCQLINGYGPTENTTFTCCHRFPRDWDGKASAPIGRPISNTQVYILDAQLKPVPIGARGELYAAGDGLALGYDRSPRVTAQNFIPNPFGSDPNARMYRTGDQARYLGDGTIEFLGRRDDQVKINGFRLHLGEVEEAMGALPGVRQVAVTAREREPGSKELVACVVVHPGLTSVELRQSAARALPAYMIPAHMVLLPSLPLTPNGKVDRRALQAINEPTPQAARQPALPETPVQQAILRVWREVFGRSEIGVDDDFFELGGHSLLATRVISRLNAALAISVSLATLFDAPTVRALAERVSQTPRESVPGSIPRRQARKL